jgi:hypothetical protein
MAGTKERKAMTVGQDPTNPVRLLLSDAHRNGLSAYLRVVEENCRTIERSLDGFQGIYYEYVRQLPDETKQEIQLALSEFLRILHELQANLGLQKREVDLPRWLNAYLTHIWEILCESKSDSLKAFGSVPDDLRAYLDPRVDELLSILKRMRLKVEGMLVEKSQGGMRE